MSPEKTLQQKKVIQMVILHRMKINLKVNIINIGKELCKPYLGFKAKCALLKLTFPRSFLTTHFLAMDSVVCKKRTMNGSRKCSAF